MSEKKINALRNNVILVRDNPDVTTDAGIIIPDIAREEKYTGTVTSAGPECEEIREGDRISFAKLSGVKFVVDEKEYIKVREVDVQFRITEDDELRVLGENILVKQDEAEERTKSGIYINVLKRDVDKPNKGYIVDAGSKVDNMEVGDRICFSKYAGRKAEYEGNQFILMRKGEVYGFIPEDDNLVVGETRDTKDMLESLKNSGLDMGDQ